MAQQGKGTIPLACVRRTSTGKPKEKRGLVLLSGVTTRSPVCKSHRRKKHEQDRILQHNTKRAPEKTRARFFHATLIYLILTTGLEPVPPKRVDFESTVFTISPSERILPEGCPSAQRLPTAGLSFASCDKTGQTKERVHKEKRPLQQGYIGWKHPGGKGGKKLTK